MDRDGVKQEQKRDESFHFPSPVLERNHEKEDKQVIIINIIAVLRSMKMLITSEDGDIEGKA